MESSKSSASSNAQPFVAAWVKSSEVEALASRRRMICRFRLAPIGQALAGTGRHWQSDQRPRLVAHLYLSLRVGRGCAPAPPLWLWVCASALVVDLRTAVYNSCSIYDRTVYSN